MTADDKQLSSHCNLTAQAEQVQNNTGILSNANPTKSLGNADAPEGKASSFCKFKNNTHIPAEIHCVLIFKPTGNKGNNKITELRTIFQKGKQNS